MRGTILSDRPTKSRIVFILNIYSFALIFGLGVLFIYAYNFNTPFLMAIHGNLWLFILVLPPCIVVFIRRTGIVQSLICFLAVLVFYAAVVIGYIKTFHIT